MNALFLTDGYKVGHKSMVPTGTTMMYSNLTPRSNKYAPNGIKRVVSFGQQMLMRKIHEEWVNGFFLMPKSFIINEVKKELSDYLGYDFDVAHFEELYDIGYLPIAVKIIPEGELVPFGVPTMTFYNTATLSKTVFDWITNYLETILSCEGWKAPTVATIALEYKKLGVKYAQETDESNIGFVDYQFHDFSMRGIDGLSGAINTGLGHATSFLGSDTLPTIPAARKYYNETGLVVCSVNASEHSVMSAGIGAYGELETYRQLLKKFPSGILSLVSDTMDLWAVLTEILPELKSDILARNGKLVIRPDSGDPVRILCGYTAEEVDEFPQYGKESVTANEIKGVIELLWELFGGTTNSQGFKVLDSHIGAIYGDSINLERAENIFRLLKLKGFSSTNVVLGVGSFSYQMITRDTLGWAVKATYVEVDGKGIPIFKSPKTDDGTKKSAKGLLAVFKNDVGNYELHNDVDWATENTGELQLLYKDGEFFNQTTLTEIRKRLWTNIFNPTKALSA
jgi:nicotinamide phosphoribosyltransferase